jgi:hypothetical protein
MSWYLIASAVLAFTLGLAHSVLGERYILTRLFRRGNLPHLFGGETFTRRTLRFTWHLTTLLAWGLGAVLLAVAHQSPGPTTGLVARTVAVTFLLCGVVAGFGSRGRHFAWVVFLVMAALAWIGAS